MRSSNFSEAARVDVIQKASEAMAKNDNVVIVHKTRQTVNDPVEIPSNFFIESVGDVAYMSDVREGLRSWFCCFIPVHEEAHGPGLERSVKLYQDLDEFPSNLIVAAAQ